MKPIHAAPELTPYQDEPKQLPSGAPGKNAFLRLGFERRGEKTALIHLDRRAPLLVQQALYCDEEMPTLPCVMIISTSGGILQGDRNKIEIDLAPHTQAHVTTQSATKIQEMDANYASQTQEIVLGEAAYLEYLPDPIIPYKNARFISHTRVSIPQSATLLYSEILMPGRKYYKDGELFEYDLFSSTVAAERPCGAELFVEKFIIEPHRSGLRQRGVMGDYDVFANVLLLTPKENFDRICEQTEAVMDCERQLAAGVSRLPNDAGLVFKVLGMEREPVQAKVREFWTVVRQQVVGAKVPEKFPWR
jgi:urease accessory protein